jgi:UDP-N-acetylmuramate dehydrogenase
VNTKDIYELLNKEIPDMEVLKNESMKKHTSFRIGGEAEIFAKAKSIEQIKAVLEICKTYNIPLTVIGNGSNLLVKDEGVKGIVLRIDLEDLNIEEQKDNKVIVTVGSGMLIGKLAYTLLNEAIAGFEFASGIPGTIGGAIKMNAGAYGKEFKDIVIETTAIDKNGKIVKFNNSEQKFEYRKSIFKNKEYIILESKLQLEKVQDSKVIKEKMDEYRASRMEKQPMDYPSAGSTFKRGEDYITAQLIDECGLKGFKVGGAQVSTKHAGFVVNTGNATAEDVLKLVQIIKEKVKEKFNKDIELEVEII